MTFSKQSSIIFYDGECAMCHGFVKFVVMLDKKANFTFAPLFGETFINCLGEKRDILPDSIVLYGTNGEYFLKSRAVAKVLMQLNGVSKLLGNFLNVIPKALADFGYDCVATLRKKIFRKPEGVCPILPQELRNRFLS